MSVSQGTTLSFGGAISGLRTMSVGSAGAEIDITSLGDAEKFYRSGVPDKTINFELIGTTSLTVGTTASTCVITWGSVTTTTDLGAMVCTNVENNAAVDENLGASVTLKRTK